MLDSWQLLTQAVSVPSFLATRDESIRLCTRIALASRVYSTSTRLVGPLRAASLRLRLEPKVALHAEHMLQETRFAKRYLVPCLKMLSKVHKVTLCFMYMIAHDIVQHSSDCDSNELDEASRSVRTTHNMLRHLAATKSISALTPLKVWLAWALTGEINPSKRFNDGSHPKGWSFPTCE